MIGVENLRDIFVTLNLEPQSINDLLKLNLLKSMF